MRPFNSEEAKNFMAEAGNDFESKARRLIQDDYAAIRQIKTASEVSEALGTIAAAVLQKEITAMEADAALKLLGQLLRAVRRANEALASGSEAPRLTTDTVRKAEKILESNRSQRPRVLISLEPNKREKLK